MMKKAFTFFMCLSMLLSAVHINAQAYRLPATPEGLKAPAIYNRHRVNDLSNTGQPTESTIFAPTTPPPASAPSGVRFRTTAQEITIGSTVYDLQTNGSNCRRINADNSGNIFGVWTKGGEPLPGSPDRGTAYNRTTGGAWGPEPAARTESVRTGWPNHVITANGQEFSVAHTGDSRLLVIRRPVGGSAWTESYIPAAVPPGLLWPRAAVGGANGQSIHVIAVTTPVANSGALYAGIDGHVLYYRSQDGGANWDIVDAIIPGLDSAFTTSSSPDGYYIDARGETIAIGVFNDFDDVLVFKSEDNGSTWTKFIVNDFPLFKYVADQGYTIDDLPPYNEEQPDTLAILTSDNSGTVLIDNDGMVHAFYGRMYVADTELTDGNTSYYPGTNGLAYWNESFGEDSTRTITGALDLNADNTLNITAITNIATYFYSLSSMPSAAIDAQGNLYVTYSAVMEGEEFIDPADNQHYRHVYVMASPDGGETWLPPFDVNVPEIAIEPDLANFIEGVFPTLARNANNNKAHLIYMQDYQPGLAVRGDSDAASENYINYIGVDIEDLGLITNTQEPVAASYFQLTAAPNPLTAPLTLRYTLPSDLPSGSKVRIDLYNALGQPVRRLFQGVPGPGDHQFETGLADLPAGVYTVSFQANGKVATCQIVKR